MKKSNGREYYYNLETIRKVICLDKLTYFEWKYYHVKIGPVGGHGYMPIRNNGNPVGDKQKRRKRTGRVDYCLWIHFFMDHSNYNKGICSIRNNRNPTGDKNNEKE